MTGTVNSSTDKSYINKLIYPVIPLATACTMQKLADAVQLRTPVYIYLDALLYIATLNLKPNKPEMNN